VIGSRLSQRARDEAEEARTREREVEVLFRLSRELLQAENVGALVNVIPKLIAQVCLANTVILYLLEGDRLYQSGMHRVSGVEIPHYRQLALTLSEPETAPDGESRLPLRAGVRPRGLLLLNGVSLSSASCQAIAGLVSIALDRAQALEQVARSEANKESERLRTLILDSITHELRTPLTSIKGAATTLLTSGGERGANERELLEIIDEETNRLNNLVGEAVEMAQLEAQQVHMHFAPTTISEIVDLARETCSTSLEGRAIQVALPDLPNVRADREMMTKVLCNLLENAAKYSRPGSPIAISARENLGAVEVSVADRGVGIDSAEQALIFDRLYRSRSQSETTSGTGMGLPISKAIVEAHQGKLMVTSQLEHGSVFTFSLPLA
jgi:two-component system, OmpR family, sensor histidine kinase KdpD